MMTNIFTRCLCALAACLVLSGCLMTTDLQEHLRLINDQQMELIEQERLQTERRLLEASLPSGSAEIGASTPNPEAIKETVEQVLAFIQAHPDKPNIIGPLWVRLGVLYMTAKQGALASAAFEQARDSGAALGSTHASIVELRDSLIWWYGRHSINWSSAYGDFDQAAELMEETKTRIEAVEKQIEADPGLREDGLDTLAWLHNLRIRVAEKLALTFTGNDEQGRRDEMAANQDFLDVYTGFWTGDDDLRHDASALRRLYSKESACDELDLTARKALSADLQQNPLVLKEPQRLRWAADVFCKIQKLQVVHYDKVGRHLAGSETLTVPGWMQCRLNAGTNAVNCTLAQ